MWKSGPSWLTWMRALASPQPEPPSRARGSPGPRRTRPLFLQLSAPLLALREAHALASLP